MRLQRIIFAPLAVRDAPERARVNCRDQEEDYENDQRGADVGQPIQPAAKQLVQAFCRFGKIEFHEIARSARHASKFLPSRR